MNWKRTACGVLSAGILLTSAQALNFTDTTSHWAKTSISRWSDYGVISGYSDGTFGPDKQITRAEMAVILSRVFGWQDTAENTFRDMTGNEWYAKDILRAKAAGVMAGDTQGNARPTAPITRQEAAVMISRALHVAGSNGGKKFSDSAQIGTWAVSAINGMSEKGYISGFDDGNFYPARTITRAEMVTILGRAVANYYNRAGVYTADNKGMTVIAAPGVALQNMTVNGDLFIAAGAYQSDVILNNVTVTGTTYVQSGAGTEVLFSNSRFRKVEVEGDSAQVEFQGTHNFTELIVSGNGASVRGLTEGTKVTVAQGTTDVVINGRKVNAGNITVGSDISTGGVDIDFTITGGSSGNTSSGSSNSGSSGSTSSGGTTPTPKPDGSSMIEIDFRDLFKQ